MIAVQHSLFRLMTRLNPLPPQEEDRVAPISATLSFPEMVLIPGGQFLMGDHHNYVDPAHPSDEVPTHTVHLDSFYMGKYEVTNQQYADYLNSALAQGLIEVRSGVVFTGTRNGLVYGLGATTCTLKPARPLITARSAGTAAHSAS